MISGRPWENCGPNADTYGMEHARGGREIWRLAVLTIGLVSMLMLAIPAQAGLGDLLDQILDPVGDLPVVGDIVDPIVQGVVDPIVDDVVEPVAGGLLDPIADQVLAPVLTPIIDTVVTPIVDEVVTPVVNNVVPPVIEPVVETVPPVGTTDDNARSVWPGRKQSPGPRPSSKSYLLATRAKSSSPPRALIPRSPPRG